MIDVRCAALPVAPSGEKLTLRLLDRENLRTFDELFLHAPVVANRCVNLFMAIPKMVV